MFQKLILLIVAIVLMIQPTEAAIVPYKNIIGKACRSSINSIKNSVCKIVQPVSMAISGKSAPGCSGISNIVNSVIKNI